MTNEQLMQTPQVDPFGRQVAARLSAATDELPYHVTERLRAARVQAVARRKVPQVLGASAVFGSGRAPTLTLGDDGISLWHRIASALPLVALVGGLFLIQVVQTEHRASEVAEVDAALLTDDLPPSAYADPGFIQFLKSGGE